MLKRKFNKKEKIILKIYIHYILKKKYLIVLKKIVYIAYILAKKYYLLINTF